jgi:CDP-4-dehydro-6-deoxyglucose reductase
VADVTILPDGLQVTAAPDETVLRALARAGLRYRVGCKRGGCGICKVQLVLGEVAYERPIAPQVLSDDERVEGVCLSCRAVPLTNVVIELQESDRLRRVLGFAFPTTPTTPTPTTNSTRAATEGNVDDERRDPAGVRAPAGDRSGRGP